MLNLANDLEKSMCCSTWLNRGTAVGLLLGVVLGSGAATAWYKSREPSKEPVVAEVPKPEPAKQDTPPDPGIELAKKDKAQLACRAIAQAIEAYSLSAQNPGFTDEERLPKDIRDLYEPPFGGTSFLRNGKADTIDPWGKSYKLTLTTRKDGTSFLLVSTTAPDGTPISQFGIGPDKAAGK